MISRDKLKDIIDGPLEDTSKYCGFTDGEKEMAQQILELKDIIQEFVATQWDSPKAGTPHTDALYAKAKEVIK